MRCVRKHKFIAYMMEVCKYKTFKWCPKIQSHLNAKSSSTILKWQNMEKHCREIVETADSCNEGGHEQTKQTNRGNISDD